MPELTRQKITFGEMRAAGVRGLLIYCSDYKCSHSTNYERRQMAGWRPAVRYRGRLRLHDLRAPLGADVRPDLRFYLSRPY
jgi:hypothetical protein